DAPTWQAVVSSYTKGHCADLQDTLKLFEQKKMQAEAVKVSVENTVSGQTRPDLAVLENNKNASEEKYKLARDAFDIVKDAHRINHAVYDALAPKMEERKELVDQHARIDRLYRLLSGNVSGSRMDIETYAQRYYMEKILYAANKRFQEMSAGQFELRMYDLEKAGEGKNRGLDLIVYSNVTGKEREVRTLSGGESFMAALSLALGMADQIQEKSSAINLDMMFIDEGFGSLDDYSREQAVKVLREMANGSKLIGIISHVTELKQQIDNQLIVKKDEQGSHVRWQIS
ncbi:MAG: DNA repair protein, partial [Peptococcaceae bacterium]|nr:DNA repair protein [Peptococcaceae bacterium]